MENIFGKPNEGAHSYRDPIFNLAIVDVVLTYALALFISRYYSYKNSIIVFIYLLIFSIFIHKLFGVKTKLLQYLHI
jgi:hypothetical protein